MSSSRVCKSSFNWHWWDQTLSPRHSVKSHDTKSVCNVLATYSLRCVLQRPFVDFNPPDRKAASTFLYYPYRDLTIFCSPQDYGKLKFFNATLNFFLRNNNATTLQPLHMLHCKITVQWSYDGLAIVSLAIFFSCDQAALWTVLPVSTFVCLSHISKWCPCQSSRSEVKVL